MRRFGYAPVAALSSRTRRSLVSSASSERGRLARLIGAVELSIVVSGEGRLKETAAVGVDVACGVMAVL